MQKSAGRVIRASSHICILGSASMLLCITFTYVKYIQTLAKRSQFDYCVERATNQSEFAFFVFVDLNVYIFQLVV